MQHMSTLSCPTLREQLDLTVMRKRCQYSSSYSLLIMKQGIKVYMTRIICFVFCFFDMYKEGIPD